MGAGSGGKVASGKFMDLRRSGGTAALITEVVVVVSYYTSL
jgi:hypothetical protein